MLIATWSTPSRRLRATSMTAAQAAQVMPAASATTFSTCAEAERLASIASIPIAASLRIWVIVASSRANRPPKKAALPIAKPEHDPRTNHGDVQDQTDTENRLDSPSSEKRGPPSHCPALV